MRTTHKRRLVVFHQHVHFAAARHREGIHHLAHFDRVGKVKRAAGLAHRLQS